MSFQIMKKAMIAAVGCAALLGAGGANATVMYKLGSGSATALTSTPVSASFAGVANLAEPIFGSTTTVTCRIILGGEVFLTPAGNAAIHVTSGQVDTNYSGNSAFCSLISFNTTTPWNATDIGSSVDGISPANLPSSATSTSVTNGTMNNVAVNVSFPGHNCSGDVTVQYSNNGTGSSYFDFSHQSLAPDCSVDGTLYADPTDIKVWNQ